MADEEKPSVRKTSRAESGSRFRSCVAAAKELTLASQGSNMNLAAQLCRMAVTIPDGVQSGDQFTVTTAWGGEFTVDCPKGVGAADEIELSLPAGPETDEQLLEQVVEAVLDDESGVMRHIEAWCLENCRRQQSWPSRMHSEDNTVEFSLEATVVHTEFVALYERLLEQQLSTLGLTSDDFVALVRRRSFRTALIELAFIELQTHGPS